MSVMNCSGQKLLRTQHPAPPIFPTVAEHQSQARALKDGAHSLKHTPQRAGFRQREARLIMMKVRSMNNREVGAEARGETTSSTKHIQRVSTKP